MNNSWRKPVGSEGLLLSSAYAFALRFTAKRADVDTQHRCLAVSDFCVDII
ncbi:MAG TPA: hypothetical protein VJN65_06665 [Bacteroidota bacterium]|nr:hypothetical protein [Bacteroidota bacterium]